MRILFVATAFSPLAARWIEQIADTGWDIHVYDIANKGVHTNFRNVTIHATVTCKGEIPPNVTYRAAWPFSRGVYRLKKHLPAIAKHLILDPDRHVAQLIQTLKPDIIHSLKMDSEAYTVFEARALLNNRLTCPWVYSVWGSDIYLNRHFPNHLNQINQVLPQIDYLMADNDRDIALALDHGFKGNVIGVFPTGGGYPIQAMQSVIHQKASERKIIAVKGYQSPQGGQALTALEALIACGSVLSPYKVIIHSAIGTHASLYFSQVQAKARELAERCNVEVEFMPFSPPESIWDLFAQSRISLAISNSDGTPNAMLESMIMGAFPIQSDTGGLETWIQSGQNGYLVPYDNIEKIAEAILHALKDDKLIDSAYDFNLQLTQSKLDYETIKKRVIDVYQAIYNKHKHS